MCLEGLIPPGTVAEQLKFLLNNTEDIYPQLISLAGGTISTDGDRLQQHCAAFAWAAGQITKTPARIIRRTHSDGHSKRSFVQAHSTTYDVLRKRGYPFTDEQFRPELVAIDGGTWRGEDGVGMWGFFSPGPEHITFTIGDTCNARCRMCWQAAARAKNLRPRYPDLPISDFQTIIDRYKSSLKAIELCSFGEPLLHPSIQEMFHACLSVGDRLSISLTTNGSLLDSKLPPEVLASPGSITVSFDSPNKATYEYIRGLPFETVRNNIAAAASSKRKHRWRRIGINMVVCQYNWREVESMIDLAHSLGLDYLALLLGDGLESTEAYDQKITNDEAKAVADIAAEWNARGKTGLTIISYVQPEKLATTACAPRVGPPLPEAFCYLPYRGFDIGPDGMAHPCCRAFDSNMGHCSEDVWHHPQLQKLRDQMVGLAVSKSEFPGCARCPLRGESVVIID